MNASTYLHGEGPPDLAALARSSGLGEAAIVVRAHPSARRRPGWSAELNPHASIYPASTIKTPLAAALTALWARDELRPETRALVTAANMTANDAESPLVPGYTTDLATAAHLMLSRSDNVATNVLIDVVGRERASAEARALGLGATAVRRKLSGSDPLIDDPEATGRNAHPPSDAAMLFGLIANRSIAGADWLYAALRDQVWNDKLSLGLRAGDVFAHKTGETDEVSHDGGILDTADGARYVIVVYTRLPAAPDRDGRFADFMVRLRPLL